MHKHSTHSPLQTRQQGVALAISLILLVVITMLSLTAMRSANLDTKITLNHQHKRITFQSAESALTRLTTVPDRWINKPLTDKDTTGANVVHTNIAVPLDPSLTGIPTTTPFYSQSDVAGPNTFGVEAQLDMDMISENGNTLLCALSGTESLSSDIKCAVYQADSYGNITSAGTGAKTSTSAHHRMIVTKHK